jgi:ubiquinone/menaquinone biosynthesis C-methylase UbiE
MLEENETSVFPFNVHKSDWEELAAFDPMWAVLSEEHKRGNRWDSEDFFATGRREIDSLLAELRPLLANRSKALDFGCGVGRLTRALLKHFGEAHGVDISAKMIEIARRSTPGCHFHLNNSQDLSLFADETFDFVYSNRVLQHMPSQVIIENYIREFFRITVPGGLVVFQVPYKKSHRNLFNLKRSSFRLLKLFGFTSETLFSRLKLHPMRMTALSKDRVHALVHDSGGELIKEKTDSSAHFAILYFCHRLFS